MQETRELPYYCDDPKLPYQKLATLTWREVGVAEIADGRLLDAPARIVGKDHTFLGDFAVAASIGFPM